MNIDSLSVLRGMIEYFVNSHLYLASEKTLTGLNDTS